jgi:hypothetical protein
MDTKDDDTKVEKNNENLNKSTELIDKKEIKKIIISMAVVFFVYSIYPIISIKLLYNL